MFGMNDKRKGRRVCVTCLCVLRLGAVGFHKAAYGAKAVFQPAGQARPHVLIGWVVQYEVTKSMECGTGLLHAMEECNKVFWTY